MLQPFQTRIERARNGARGAADAPLALPSPTTAAGPLPGSVGHFGLLSLSAVERRGQAAAHSSEKTMENRPDGRLAICRLMRMKGSRSYEGRVFRHL
jgi:hypothetical protein